MTSRWLPLFPATPRKEYQARHPEVYTLDLPYLHEGFRDLVMELQKPGAQVISGWEGVCGCFLIAMHSIRFNHSNMRHVPLLARTQSKEDLGRGSAWNLDLPSLHRGLLRSTRRRALSFFGLRHLGTAEWKVANLWILRAYLMTSQWSQQLEVPPEILTWLVRCFTCEGNQRRIQVPKLYPFWSNRSFWGGKNTLLYNSQSVGNVHGD